MDGSELPHKRKKFDLSASKTLSVKDSTVSPHLNGDVCITKGSHTINSRELSSNGNFLPHFLERLKLKTIPHVSPLLQRLSEIENKSIIALASIDQINSRIRELDCFLSKMCTVKLKNPDIDENKRNSTTLTLPTHVSLPPTLSQSEKLANFFDKEIDINLLAKRRRIKRVPYSPSSYQVNKSCTIDLTGKETNDVPVITAAPPNVKIITPSLDQISARFLPVCPVTSMISSPKLTSSLVKEGICLQWDIQFIDPSVCPSRFEINSFQKSEITANNFPWRKIGEVAALPLPMACTLTYVSKMNTYFFAVRAWIKDIAGSWSNVIMVEIK